jgi:hypothetical protein
MEVVTSKHTQLCLGQPLFSHRVKKLAEAHAKAYKIIQALAVEGRDLLSQLLLDLDFDCVVRQKSPILDPPPPPETHASPPSRLNGVWKTRVQTC